MINPGQFRLAFVAPRFSERGTIGGAETLLKNLAEHAAAAGCRVDFLTTCAENHFTWENTVPPGTREVAGMQVHFFPVDGGRDLETFLRTQEAISRRAHVTAADEEAWMRNNVNSSPLYDHLRRQAGDYDAVIMGPYLFSLTYYASAIAPEKTLLVPCLHDEPFAYLTIMQRMFAQVAGFLFNTEPERGLARRIFAVPEEKSEIVGMGLEPFTADAAAFRKRSGLMQPFLLYSGRREPLKGTPLLLDYVHAFRQRTGRDVKLVFTGSGPIEAPPELTPHILDLGFVSEEEKHDAMSAATAFVHPSVNESLGIVLLESWLAGTPALVRQQGVVLQWQCARSGGGLWFRNYPEFEEELLLLLDHEDARKTLGENGRRYVLDEYRWDAVMSRFFDAVGRMVPGTVRA